MDSLQLYANTTIHALFGPVNKMFYVLMILVVFDYITGICVAIHDKKVSSIIGFNGICKKVVIFLMVSLSYLIGTCIDPDSYTLCTITTVFYAINECMSIFENANILGIPIPEKLKKALDYFDQIKK